MGDPTRIAVGVPLKDALRPGRPLEMGVMGRARTLDTRLEYDAPEPLVPLVRAMLDASRMLPVPAQVGLTLGTAGALLLALGLSLRRWTTSR